MTNGDLYPKGKTIWCRQLGEPVQYVCHAGNGLHIVLAPPLDHLDDRVREVRSDQLVDEAVIDVYEREVSDKTDQADFLRWFRTNQAQLARAYDRKYGYLSPFDDLDSKFLMFAIFRYEVHRLAAEIAPGTRTRQ